MRSEFALIAGWKRSCAARSASTSAAIPSRFASDISCCSSMRERTSPPRRSASRTERSLMVGRNVRSGFAFSSALLGLLQPLASLLLQRPDALVQRARVPCAAGATPR